MSNDPTELAAAHDSVSVELINAAAYAIKARFAVRATIDHVELRLTWDDDLPDSRERSIRPLDLIMSLFVEARRYPQLAEQVRLAVIDEQEGLLIDHDFDADDLAELVQLASYGEVFYSR